VCIGGHCGSTVLLLAGSPTANLLTGTFQIGSGWTTATLADIASFGIALTLDSTGRGVGVYASSTNTINNVVMSTVWSNGSWGVPSAISASAVARSQPYVDATGGTTSHLVYQDSTYHYWYLGYSGTWSGPQPMGTASNQSFGPFAATIAARGADATAAFFEGANGSNVNFATASDLTGGTWQGKVYVAGNTIGGNSSGIVVPAAVIPLGAQPDLLMIYVQSDSKIMFTIRTSGLWSAPVYITNGFTNDPVALAPLPGGGAILAFRGIDTPSAHYLYWSVYSGGAWSTVAPFSTPNVAIDTSPAVTHGIGGDVAEIAYVGSGQAYHARLQGSAWSSPVMVGGGSLSGVAIAAAP
jgi:hypothetical protein